VSIKLKCKIVTVSILGLTEDLPGEDPNDRNKSEGKKILKYDKNYNKFAIQRTVHRDIFL